jgi:hypothetical protein
MTAQTIITLAMRRNGDLAPGQDPNPTESALALPVLNSILDHWMILHRGVFVIDNKQYPLTDGKGDYTIGPDGDFDTERPVKIESAGVIYYRGAEGSGVSGIRKPLDLVPSKDFAPIPEKAGEALEPLQLYNDNDYPLAGLHLWPVPRCAE